MLWLLIRYSVSPSDSTTSRGPAEREDKPILGAGIVPFRVEGIQCNDLPSRSWLFLLGFLRAQCQSNDDRLTMHQKWWLDQLYWAHAGGSIYSHHPWYRGSSDDGIIVRLGDWGHPLDNPSDWSSCPSSCASSAVDAFQGVLTLRLKDSKTSFSFL